MYFAYIIQSEKDGSLYKGHTDNLKRRLSEHNSGKSRYTSTKMPWRLVYYETFSTKEEAMQREKYFKTAAGRRFIKKLELGAGSPPDRMTDGRD